MFRYNTHPHTAPRTHTHTHTHTLALVEEKAQDLLSPQAAAPWLTAQTSPSPKPFSTLGFAAPALLCLTSVLPLWNCTLNMHLTQSDLFWWGFQGGSVVKNLLANAGDKGLIPGWGRSPRGGNGNLLHYSCPENFMHREAWWATVHGVAKSQTWRSTHTHTTLFGIYINSEFLSDVLNFFWLLYFYY